jgi:ribosomal protein L29
MATANELRQMKPEELDRMLSEQREALFNLRLKLRSGHLENTASLGKARREIARLTTVLHEAQLGIEHPVKAPAGEGAPAAAAKPKRKGPSKHRAPAHKTKAKSKTAPKTHKTPKPKAKSHK